MATVERTASDCEVHDVFHLPGRVGREPAWVKCVECGEGHARGYDHKCGAKFLAYWCVDIDEAGVFTLGRSKLQRSPLQMSSLHGVEGPFDATRAGRWFGERLRPQHNCPSV